MENLYVYDNTKCEDVEVTLQECPRCKGFGRISSDKGDDCYVCNGEGEVYYNTHTGTTYIKSLDEVSLY